MKYIKLFEYYNNIDSICNQYNINNYTINNGLVDVDGGVSLTRNDFTELPLKFGKVENYFICFSNKLTTLKGAPIEVGYDFDCHGNQLTSLKYSPVKVAGFFICNDNKLTSLEGCPVNTDGFSCGANQLTSLKYGPSECNNSYLCNNNQLTSLKYIPEYINGALDFSNNNIKTTEYLPIVNNSIIFSNNLLPKEIYDNKDYIKYIAKYQYEYKIWNKDNTLNLQRFKLLISENEIY